jgi:uncharacterized membrane protein
MNLHLILAMLIIGFATGLRSMTSPAVVAWAAHLGRLSLGATFLSFMASPIPVGIFTLFAIGEYIADLLPNTPNRTSAVGLSARFITGSFSGACLAVVTGNSAALGLIAGVAAIGGAFAGYYARTGLVKSLGVKDAFIAIPEDLVAIGLAIISICFVSS